MKIAVELKQSITIIFVVVAVVVDMTARNMTGLPGT